MNVFSYKSLQKKIKQHVPDVQLKNQAVFAKLAASRLFFAPSYGREGSSPTDNRHTEEHFTV